MKLFYNTYTTKLIKVLFILLYIFGFRKEFLYDLNFIYLFILCDGSPSSPSPVTQQMTAMSISQDSGAVDCDRAEAEEGEEEGTSNSTGKHHRKKWSFPKLHYEVSHGQSHAHSNGGYFLFRIGVSINRCTMG